MEGRCRRCGEKLSLLQRLQGQDFCSAEHRVEFQREQEQMALARLQQTASSLRRNTSSKTPTFVSGSRKAEAPPVLDEPETPVAPRAAAPPPAAIPPAPPPPPPPPPPAARRDPPEGGFTSGGYCVGDPRVADSGMGPVDFVPLLPAIAPAKLALRENEAADPPQAERMLAVTAAAARGDVETILVTRIAPLLTAVAGRIPPCDLTVVPYRWDTVHRWLEFGPSPAPPFPNRAPAIRVWEPQPRAPEPDACDPPAAPLAISARKSRTAAALTPAPATRQHTIVPPEAVRGGFVSATVEAEAAWETGTPGWLATPDVDAPVFRPKPGTAGKLATPWKQAWMEAKPKLVPTTADMGLCPKAHWSAAAARPAGLPVRPEAAPADPHQDALVPDRRFTGRPPAPRTAGTVDWSGPRVAVYQAPLSRVCTAGEFTAALAAAASRLPVIPSALRTGPCVPVRPPVEREMEPLACIPLAVEYGMAVAPRIPAAAIAADTDGCGIAPPVWTRLAALPCPPARAGEAGLLGDADFREWPAPTRHMSSGLSARVMGLTPRRNRLDMGAPMPDLAALPWLEPVMCPFGGEFGTR